MTGDAGLRCKLVQPAPVAVIELCGHLNLETAGRLRLAVEKVLAEPVEVIVVDLSGPLEVDGLCVSIFPTLGRLAQEREVPVVLAGPSTALRRALRVSPLFVHVVDSRAEAVTVRAGSGRGGDHARLSLSADTYAPTRARNFTAVRCAEHRRADLTDDLTDDAVLVANELVTNAVEHVGHGEIVLVLRFRRRYLRVEVHDRDPALPDARRSHGLTMVDAVSANWGWRPTFDGLGKVVWADLSLDVPRRASARG